MKRALVGLVACACACGPTVRGDDDDDVGAGGDAATGGGDGGDTLDDTCRRMDILFVIDDSISMAQEQRNLAENFPGFIRVLDDYRTSAGTPLDYHVAVTTTGRTYDKFLRNGGMDYANGHADGADGGLPLRCGMSRRWLERGDADVSGTFACIAAVGIGGPTDEMPLATTRLALEARVADGTNAGFLRDDALLAIVVLTDEDDCSTSGGRFTVDGAVPVAGAGACVPGRPVELTDVAETIGFLDGLKGDPGRWATAVIAGPGPQTCNSGFGDAIPATRLLDLVARKQPLASFSSVCEGNLTHGLADAIATFDRACQAFPPID